jgi:DnaJ-class molecular chaperone
MSHLDRLKAKKHAEPEPTLCPTCSGAGELTERANDGTHGCSHIFDRTWTCTDCDGTGDRTSTKGTST